MTGRGLRLDGRAGRRGGRRLVGLPAAVHKPKKGRPAPSLLEELDTRAFRIIDLRPIEDVFEKPFDYSRTLTDKTPRIAFDFPGNYTTPALVVRDGRMLVEVGDDLRPALSRLSGTVAARLASEIEEQMLSATNGTRALLDLLGGLGAPVGRVASAGAPGAMVGL